MSTRSRSRLPALSALVTFEAAARLNGFTRAAQELSVTPGAVSHQIKSLEQQLGIALFQRSARGVTLTAQGDELYQVLHHSLDQLAQTIEHLRNDQQQRPITVSATTAMSSLWLTPRLSEFWRMHPEVAVNQHVSDDATDVRQTDLDIRYGPMNRSGTGGTPVQHLLFRDQLAPLCSPEFAHKHPCITLDQLAEQPLIHLERTARHWTNWTEWFESLGCPVSLSHGTHVNNYTIALQCARDGVGIVLGWLELVRPLLERGVLVSLSEHRLEAPYGFHLACQEDTLLTPPTRLLRDWLLDQKSQSGPS